MKFKIDLKQKHNYYKLRTKKDIYLHIDRNTFNKIKNFKIKFWKRIKRNVAEKSCRFV